MVIRAGCVSAVVAGCLTTAGMAFAAGNGLPRTYDVARYDSPSPAATAQYPLGLANAGDLNGDGKEDFITSQLANTRNDAGAIVANGNGAIYIINGVTGERIKTIESPDPGGTGNAANFAFPWVSKVGTNRRAAPFTDIGSCSNPSPNAGELCRSAAVGAPDGVPDILVGARGVDARGLRDAGRVYVFDGATFALLKRIDQPASDTTAVALSRPGGTWFGRTVLNPSGLPPCEGNAGVGSCETMPHSVAAGDVNGGGTADIVVGASSTSEDSASADPSSHCARTSAPGATCAAAGRVYVFHGEDIVGSNPGEILDGTVPAGGSTENVTTIRNIHAQADTTSPTNTDPELFGNFMVPVGDVGRCRELPATETRPVVPVPGPGQLCPRAQGATTPDGKPEFVVGASRMDLPVDNPDPSFADAGAAYLIDGATSTVLTVYRNPQPQIGALFGSVLSPFATGDLGDIGLPDVFVTAPSQNLPGATAAGRGFVMNGNFLAGVSSVNFATLDDPTPGTSGNFGGSFTGVGDLVPGSDTPANEVLVGASGGFFGSGPKNAIFSDVHFFNASSERVLQSVADPDNQAASQFGEEIIPLGDLNGDSFLDFGVAAPLFDSPEFTDQGRVYVFRSDNSPAPVPAPPAPSSASGPPPAPVFAPPTALAPASPGVVVPTALREGRCANDMVGTDDGESLLGTIAGDTIFGRAGDDVIEALRGHDCVDAGKDDDNVTGGSGNDSVLGGDGADRLRGGSGADRVFGQEGNDSLVGNSGRDMLAGGDGSDRLHGDGDRDRLFGERGDDRLYAGGSSGNLLDGGSGNDRIWAVNGKRDTVRCGSGRDRAIVDRKDRVSGCEGVRRRRT